VRISLGEARRPYGVGVMWTGRPTSEESTHDRMG
jgi:hypothetical protein